MGWYSPLAWKMAQETLKNRQLKGNMLLNSVTVPESKSTTVTLIITNMKSEADQRRIVNELKKIYGIIKVNVNLQRRWLIVTYNMYLTRIEVIHGTLTKLGYSTVKKT